MAKVAATKKEVKKEGALGKGDLIEHVARASGLPKTKVEEVVDGFFDFITKKLKEGQVIRLVGFLSFKVVKKAARTGRNPATGKEIKIPARNSIKVQVGKKLKDAV